MKTLRYATVSAADAQTFAVTVRSMGMQAVITIETTPAYPQMYVVRYGRA